MKKTLNNIIPCYVQKWGKLTGAVSKVILSSLRLVKVPGDININCVEAGGFVLL